MTGSKGMFSTTMVEAATKSVVLLPILAMLSFNVLPYLTAMTLDLEPLSPSS
jgi:hypothetical protein